MANLTRWMTMLAWLLLAAALAAFAMSIVRWHRVDRINAMIRDRSIATLAPLPDDPRVRYAAAWNLERAQRLDEAVKLFTDAQATSDRGLSSEAWFALGNAYFESGVKASRASGGEASTVESAEFDLARDAYRAALRVDPALHGARYNLELLERLAPRRPGEGWRRNTDPVAIQPDRHNGWTTIQESVKRGLP
jgi:mxaK protein